MEFNFVMKLFVFVAAFGVTIAGIVPAAPLVSAPVVAPAAIGYAKAVPYNVPPHSSRVDISTRALAAPLVAAPAARLIAAPAAPVIAAHAAPVIAAHAAYAEPAAYSAPLIPSPYVAAPGVTTFAGSLTAPLAQYAAGAYGPAVLG